MNVYHAMRAVHVLVDKARIVLKKRNAAARLLAAKSKDILSHTRWEVLFFIRAFCFERRRKIPPL